MNLKSALLLLLCCLAATLAISGDWTKKELLQKMASIRAVGGDVGVIQAHFRRAMKHAQARSSFQKRFVETRDFSPIEALLDPVGQIFDLHGLSESAGENACNSGYQSAIAEGGICEGLEPDYPEIGETLELDLDSGVHNLTLYQKTELLNLWIEEASPPIDPLAVQVSQLFFDLMINKQNDLDLITTGPYGYGGKSMLETLCRAMGPFPYHLSCSAQVNIRVIRCGFDNAGVYPEYLNPDGLPIRRNNTEDQFVQNNWYFLCEEFLVGSPSPAEQANTAVHEIAHILQGGFGDAASATFFEGGATFVESQLLGLQFRPMAYASSIEPEIRGIFDWNDLAAAHIYSSTQNSRKFYQIHQMLFSYFSKTEILGKNNLLEPMWQSLLYFFGSAQAPMGREIFEFFLQDGNPEDFVAPAEENGNFLVLLGDFWASVFATCAPGQIVDPTFTFPAPNGDSWLWDCSSFEKVDSQSGSFQLTEGLRYGAARVVELLNPKDLEITGSNFDVVTYRVITSSGGLVRVDRVTADSPKLTLTGELDYALVVAIQVDPDGEILPEGEGSWHVTTLNAYEGNSWYLGSDFGPKYFNNAQDALHSPFISIPATGTTTLTFKAQYSIEPFGNMPPFDFGLGCVIDAWDGMLFRLIRDDGEQIYPEIAAATAELAYAALVNVGWSNKPAFECPAGFFTESTDGQYIDVSVDLSAYAGGTYELELLFLSDEIVSSSGVWIDDFVLENSEAGVIFMDDADTSVNLMQRSYSIASNFGDVALDFLGRPPPYLVRDGYVSDSSLVKDEVRQTASWSATWSPVCSPKREWIGTSTTAYLLIFHPANIESVIEQKAPFSGQVRSATYFFDISVSDIAKIRVTLRNHKLEPLAAEYFTVTSAMRNFARMQGMVTFDFGENNSPFFNCGETFYIGFEPIQNAFPTFGTDSRGAGIVVPGNDVDVSKQFVLRDGKLEANPFNGTNMLVAVDFIESDAPLHNIDGNGNTVINFKF